MFRSSLKLLTRASTATTLAKRAMIPRISITFKAPSQHTCIGRRFNSTSATIKGDAPQLMIAFTCKKCDTRSSHTFSKQAYTTGLVLIQCPGCKNRHLIADNLNIFRDNKVNLEDLLKAQGESVATTTDDLAFEDIPELLKGVLGRYAKDAPKEFQEEDGDQKCIENK